MKSDLFFVQGYNVRTRPGFSSLEFVAPPSHRALWAEILGPKEIKRGHIGNRLFMYRGDLEQELKWYHPHGPRDRRCRS